ncbi:hypothetical protein HD841_000117 [Sphingomonas melonis]|uniref:Uncharacterized protein n=1 Tax=Sphingomonas melonis TaxID=152682 RepID=A0A7Y9FJL8_9SPHN|nr:hypothetical protein [Sphingomonas melonis]
MRPAENQPDSVCYSTLVYSVQTVCVSNAGGQQIKTSARLQAYFEIFPELEMISCPSPLCISSASDGSLQNAMNAAADPDSRSDTSTVTWPQMSCHNPEY